MIAAAGAGAAAGAPGAALSGLDGLGALGAALLSRTLVSDAALAADSSSLYVQELRKLAPAEVPALAALSAALRHPLPELRVQLRDFKDYGKLSQLLGGEPPLLPVRAVDAADMCPLALTRHLSYALFSIDFRASDRRSEMDITVDVAVLVARLLGLLCGMGGPGLQFSTAHNLADSSDATRSGLRPEFLCWAQHALVFKGEYKMSAEQWEEAKADLLEKMTGGNVLALSGLPYLLCYAVAGPQLQFFALHEHNSAGIVSMELTPISDILYINELVGRAAAVVHTFNIFRLLSRLMHCVRHSTGVPFGVTNVRGTRELHIDRQVVKVCKPTASRDVAEELYSRLAAGLPHCIRVLKQRWSGTARVSLTMAPVAMQTAPKTPEEHKAAMRCALTALAALHASGFVHRDVRAPNILFAGGSQWLLIDFEAADREGSCMPTDVVADAYLPPEVEAGNPGAPYTAAGDVYCLGKVLQAWAQDAWLGPTGRALLAAMLNKDPTKRPTASAALADPWLA